MATVSAEWEKTTWGTLATLEYGKGLRDYRDSDGQYPVFGTNGQIGWHGDFLYPSEGVIVGRKGAYRGIHYSDRPFFVIDTAFYLKPVTEGSFCTKWAYYQLLDFDINKMDSGSAIPSTSRDAFYAIELYVPPLPTQRKIAAILSAYDDLIENNLRRIKILEEMAQNLYREWFVKFRSPGHQDVRFVDSPLGKIPEGWEVMHLGDVADVRWGDTSTTKKAYVDDGFLAFSAAGPDGKLDHYDFDRDGIVLSAIGANCGLTWFTTGKWSCIKNTIRFWSTDSRASTEYLYYATQGKEFWPRRGAAQPFISQRDAQGIAILVPDDVTGRRFKEVVTPAIDLSRSLSEKNVVLRRTRDLLLPRLIAGEVDVSDLDIAVPEEEVAA